MKGTGPRLGRSGADEGHLAQSGGGELTSGQASKGLHWALGL